jgi:DNA polymerase-3 subunit beta
LSNVLLSAESGKLKIVATNMEIGITTEVEAVVEEEGKLTVEARLLSEFVNTLPSDAVEIRSDPVRATLHVVSGRDKAAINGIDADDFPVISKMEELEQSDGTTIVTVEPHVFREMIGQVEFSAASDDSRPVLAGVLCRFENSTVTLAAADGFRLALRDGTLQEPIEGRLDVIVPARALRELARIIADSEEPVKLAVTPSQSQLIARSGQTELLSRLIDGTFPDVRQIIPRDFNTRVELGRDAFINAVRRASYFARDNNDVIRVTVHPGDSELTPGTVEVSAKAAERGNSESFVDASVTGTGLEIAFNARYLSDVLGVIRQGQVLLGLNGANQAGVVRPAGSEDFTHVIMPMVIGAH